MPARMRPQGSPWRALSARGLFLGLFLDPVLGLVVGLLLVLAGCQPRGSSPSGAGGSGHSGERAATAGEDQPAGGSQPTQPPTERPLLAPPEWYVLLLGGGKAGTFVERRFSVQEGGQKLVEIVQRGEIRVTRNGHTAVQTFSHSSLETPEGQLVRCRSEFSVGQGVTVTSIRPVGDALELQTTTIVEGGSTQTTTSRLDWSEGIGGFFHEQQALRAQPLRPGERRQFKYLSPGPAVQIGQVELAAQSLESTDVLGQTRRLLRVRKTESLGDNALEFTLWCDEAGRIVKTTGWMGMELYATTQAVAESLPDSGSYDLAESLFIAVPPLQAPLETPRVTYRLRLKGDDPVAVFPSGSGQKVEREGAAALVTVYRRRPVDGLGDGTGEPSPAGPPDAADDEPSDADRAPNSLVQSDDPRVRELAALVDAGDGDSWRLACELEQLVYRRVDRKNFSRAFATAAEVAASGEGDCTEHAVLLAALLRARGLPARIAYGLIYYVDAQGRSGFGYHMWTEVHVRGQWYALDATLGRGGGTATHIRLASHHLAGTSAFNVFLPLARIADALTIEIVREDPVGGTPSPPGPVTPSGDPASPSSSPEASSGPRG